MRLQRYGNSDQELDRKRHDDNHRNHDRKSAEAGPLPRETPFHLPDPEIDLRSLLSIPTVRKPDWESCLGTCGISSNRL